MTAWEPIVPGTTPRERILRSLFDAGEKGMSRSEIGRIFYGNRPSDEIVVCLRELLADGLIRGERKEKPHSRGRTAEVWYIAEKGRLKCKQQS